jgi:hypothetical protein
MHIHHIPLIYKRNLGTNTYLHIHSKHTSLAIINAGPCVKQTEMHPLTHRRHVLNINAFLTTQILSLSHGLALFKAHTGHLLLKLLFRAFWLLVASLCIQ